MFPQGGDLECFLCPQGRDMDHYLLPYGGKLAYYFSKLSNGWPGGGGWAQLELTYYLCIIIYIFKFYM